MDLLNPYTVDLYDLFDRYYDEQRYLDPDEPAEHHILAGDPSPQSVALRTVDQLDWALRTCRGDDGVLGEAISLQIGRPVGGSFHAWCHYLADLLPQVAAEPRAFISLREYSRPPLPRTSRFTDLETANEASTQVLRANESTVRAWAADHRGLPRLHLYADLGRTIGRVIRKGPEEGAPAEVAAASACVVTMTVDQQTGGPVIAVAYPEIALPARPRERYRDLPFVFGAHFGQDVNAMDGTRWWAERTMNRSLGGAARTRVAGQLEQLLTEDDDSLRACVEALGSYVLPGQLRRWVTGLHRRMTRIDWTERR